MEAIIKINKQSAQPINSFYDMEKFMVYEMGLFPNSNEGKELENQLKTERIVETEYHTYFYMPETKC